VFLRCCVEHDLLRSSSDWSKNCRTLEPFTRILRTFLRTFGRKFGSKQTKHFETPPFNVLISKSNARPKSTLAVPKYISPNFGNF